jgi:hypothetical protein
MSLKNMGPRRAPQPKTPEQVEAWVRGDARAAVDKQTSLPVDKETDTPTDKEIDTSVHKKMLASTETLQAERPRRRGEVTRKRTGAVKRRVTFYIDVELAERLMILAVREGTDASVQAESAVRLYLQSKS